MRRTAALFTAAVLVFSSCSGDDGPDTIRVYTSVTQGTVDAVLEAFGLVNPGVEVVVFRAPTGELNARIAAEQREGGIQADVLWLTDPLSMQAYDASGVLASWDPVGAAALDPAFASERFWGTRLLDVIIVHGPDVDPAPVSWTDLVATAASGGVAMPDPGFAGSAFAALGYFALTEGYGMGFYEDLAGAGAVQVPAPGDVVTGVAEGRYAAGITLSAIARNAVEDGSPIVMVWPEPGAIAVYSPIAVIDGSTGRVAAEEFVEFVLDVGGQTAIGATGWRPVLEGIPGPEGGPVVTLDWSAAFDRQDQLLNAYREIFGG